MSKSEYEVRMNKYRTAFVGAVEAMVGRKLTAQERFDAGILSNGATPSTAADFLSTKNA